MVVEFDGFPGQLSPTSIVLQEQNFKQMSLSGIRRSCIFASFNCCSKMADLDSTVIIKGSGLPVNSSQTEPESLAKSTNSTCLQ